MSVRNFKPIVWAKEIELNREKMMVAAKLCNRDYEGEIKELGDKVKINGVSRPTISDYDDVNGLGDFERLQDQSTMLEITQSKAFHFYVGDIDKRQSAGNIMNAELTEAAAALAEVMDSYIYSLYKDAGIVTNVDSLTDENVLNVINRTLGKLWKNNVPTTEQVSLEVTPEFLTKLQMAKLLNDTDNSSTLASGISHKLKTFNIDVYMSNNLPKEGTSDICILRTKKAISFAEQLKEVKAYEPHNFFGEAVKGLQVYGAKVIRPDELAVIKIDAYN